MPSPRTMDQLNSERAAFWAALAEEMSEADSAERTGQEQHFALGDDLLDGRLRMVMSVSQDKTSVYLVARSDEAKRWVSAHLAALQTALRAAGPGDKTNVAAGRWFRRDDKKNVVTLRSRWPEMRRWLRAQHATFQQAACAVQKDNA